MAVPAHGESGAVKGGRGGFRAYPPVASSRSVGVTVCDGAASVADKGMSGDQRRCAEEKAPVRERGDGCGTRGSSAVLRRDRPEGPEPPRRPYPGSEVAPRLALGPPEGGRSTGAPVAILRACAASFGLCGSGVSSATFPVGGVRSAFCPFAVPNISPARRRIRERCRQWHSCRNVLPVVPETSCL